jgi:hypothetical protein
LTWDPADPELEPGRVEEKTGKEKTRSDSATRLTQQDPLIFIFFIETTSF